MLNRSMRTPIYPVSLSDCLIQTDPLSDAPLIRKLTRSLPTKDGGTLRTVLDARAYMLRLSKDRERSARWQRAAQLLDAKADVAPVSRQLDLALLYDGKLDVAQCRCCYGPRPAGPRAIGTMMITMCSPMQSSSAAS